MIFACVYIRVSWCVNLVTRWGHCQAVRIAIATTKHSRPDSKATETANPKAKSVKNGQQKDYSTKMGRRFLVVCLLFGFIAAGKLNKYRVIRNSVKTWKNELDRLQKQNVLRVLAHGGHLYPLPIPVRRIARMISIAFQKKKKYISQQCM